jgi:hypothetical protein
MFTSNQYPDSPLSASYGAQLRNPRQPLPLGNSTNNGNALDFSFLSNPPNGLSQMPYERYAGLSRLGYHSQSASPQDWERVLAAQQSHTRGQINSWWSVPGFVAELDTGAPITHSSPPCPFSSPPGPSAPESSSGLSSSPCASFPNATITIIPNEVYTEPWSLEPELANSKVSPPLLTRNDHEENQAGMGRRLFEMARRLEEVTLQISRGLEYKQGLVQGMQYMLEDMSSPRFSEGSASDAHTYPMYKDTSKQGVRENIPEFLRAFGTPPPRETLSADDDGRPRCELGRPVGKALTPEEAKGGFKRCSKHREANFALNMAIYRKQKNPWSPWTCQ